MYVKKFKKKYGLMIYVYDYKNASKMNFEIFSILNSCKNAVPKYTLDAYEKAYTHTHRHTDEHCSNYI